MKNIFTIGLSVLALTSTCAMNVVHANDMQKVAYVNTAKIFQSLPQREVVVEQIQKDFKAKTDELKKIETNLADQVDKLKRDGALLSADELEKLRVDVAQLDSEFKVKLQAFEQATARREAEEKAKLFKLIQDAVQSIATKQGYDMVIDIAALVYATPQLDISEQVIQNLK